MSRASGPVLLLLTVLALAAGHGSAGEDGAPPAPEATEPPVSGALGPGGAEGALEVAGRYFAAGRYAESARRYRNLLQHPDFQALAPLPPLDPATIPQSVVEERLAYAARRLQRQRNREEAHFFYARSLMELGEDRPEAYDTALNEFRFLAQNRRGLLQPQYMLESRLWLGRTYLRMGRPAEAAEALRRLLDLSPPMHLDARASQLYASALLDQVRSFPEERGTGARDRILKRALEELNRIRIYYPNHPERQAVEVRLIELHLELRDYLKAAELADAFLRSERTPAALREEARLYRARAAYALGEVERAAEMYAEVLSAAPPGDPRRAEAEYGLGWSYAQLATSAGPTERPRLLAQAEGSLRRALDDLPAEHPQAPLVRYALSEVLVRLGEWEAALRVVAPLTHEPGIRLRAHALAGEANRGAGNPEEALRHYEQVLRHGDANLPLGFLLENRFAAAAIHEARGRPGLALDLYLKAGSEARRLRNWPLAARADLGAARTLTDLGRMAEASESLMPETLAAALGPLLAAPPPEDAREAVLRLEDHLRGFVHRAGAGPDNFARALRILELLRRRHSDRVRGDELDYEEGRAYFLQARARANELLPHAVLDPDRLRPAFDLYARAASIMERGARTNPQSTFAPRVSFVLGRIQQERGRLLMRLAGELRERDELGEARLYEEQARILLAESAQTFVGAIQSPEITIPLRLEAQETLAGVYRELEEYARAAEEFRILAEDPSADAARRIRARRLWARSLSDIGRTDEAVRRLQPFVSEDPATALLAGRLYESLARLEEARAAYEGGIAACRRSGDNCGAELPADLAFRLHRLGLERTAALYGDQQVEARRAEAASALRRLAQTWPETSWASRALEAVGAYLLETGNWQQARRVAQSGQEAAAGSPPRVWRMGLLEARALVAGGRLETAGTILREIETAASQDPETRAIAAAAIREQGTIAGLEGKPDEALLLYARVFAEYPSAREEADRARIAAADLYAQEGRYDLAFSVLANAHDPTLVRPYRERIEAMARSESR